MRASSCRAKNDGCNLLLAMQLVANVVAEIVQRVSASVADVWPSFSSGCAGEGRRRERQRQHCNGAKDSEPLSRRGNFRTSRESTDDGWSATAPLPTAASRSSSIWPAGQARPQRPGKPTGAILETRENRMCPPSSWPPGNRFSAVANIPTQPATAIGCKDSDSSGTLKWQQAGRKMKHEGKSRLIVEGRAAEYQRVGQRQPH